MKNYPTPHIDAAPEDFAKTVLMPGDPLRSKFIAENFLTNARLVNSVRGINGYTGEYNGVSVSVMASGMGMPSMGIYSYELYNFFGVENIINFRVFHHTVGVNARAGEIERAAYERSHRRNIVSKLRFEIFGNFRNRRYPFSRRYPGANSLRRSRRTAKRSPRLLRPYRSRYDRAIRAFRR